MLDAGQEPGHGIINCPQRSDQNPEPDPSNIPGMRSGKGLSFSGQLRRQGEHLVGPKALFLLPLVISAAGKGAVFLHGNNPVQHKLTVRPAIQGQIIFF